MALQFLQYGLLFLFPAALAYAATSDLVSFTIPNVLVLAIVVLFVVLALITGMSWGDLGAHAAAGAVVLVLGFLCFAFGWIGGGDAKFAAAVALFLGASNALEFIGYASVLGGILTLGLLGFRQVPVPDFIGRQTWVQRLHSSASGVPYGIALAAAGALIYPHSVWMSLVAG